VTRTIEFVAVLDLIGFVGGLIVAVIGLIFAGWFVGQFGGFDVVVGWYFGLIFAQFELVF